MKFPIVRYHPEDIHIEDGWAAYEKLEKV